MKLSLDTTNKNDSSGYDVAYGFSVQRRFSDRGVTTISSSVIVGFFFVVQIYWEWFPVQLPPWQQSVTATADFLSKCS
jgi:hypothetical protein